MSPTDKLDPRKLTERAGGGRFHAWIVLGLTLIALYVCYLLAKPFLPALAWALVLSVLFLPAHEWIEAKVRSVNVAAGVSVLLLGVIVMIPALLIGQRLLQEAAAGAVAANAKISSGDWLRAIESSPTLEPLADWIDQIDLPEAIGRGVTTLSETSASLLRASAGHIFTLLLTFYIAFYFLRDRAEATELLIGILPLPEADTRDLLGRALDTIHATVYGTLVVAAVQGALGGLMFWWLGLPQPLLWGTIMGALAIIPVLGAFVVWAPTAAFLAFEGSWGSALILTGWGVGVVGVVDNVLYPMLVGNRLRMHTIPAFMAIVGGLLVFGAAGFVLGPLAVTAAIFLLELWGTRIPEPDAHESSASN